MVIGDRATLGRAARVSGLPAPVVDVIATSTLRRPTRSADAAESAGGGHAAYGYVRRAGGARARGARIEVIVTAPLNKAALHLAGHRFDGHTELLQHLTNAPSSIMLLASERLSTIHVSTHVSLADAARRCRTARVLETIEAADHHFRALGTERPRVAVAGLNPHSGEGGLFGREDEEEIRPAIEQARAQGIDASGPWPGDSVFLRARPAASSTWWWRSTTIRVISRPSSSRSNRR